MCIRKVATDTSVYSPMIQCGSMRKDLALLRQRNSRRLSAELNDLVFGHNLAYMIWYIEYLPSGERMSHGPHTGNH